MNNNNKKPKSASANKVAMFFKKNIYFVLMIACIIAIGAMITVAAVVNANKDADTAIDNPVTPPQDETPVIDETPDDTPIVTEKEFILTYPLTEYVIGLTFSNTELVYLPTNGHWATHEAVDFMADEGSNVLCVFDGTITSITTDQLYATSVVIQHQNGYESTYRLLENVTVSVGDSVKQGDVIGQVSVAGAYECASGAHVHYELRLNDVLIDPFDFLPEGNK
ncbi:MAG: peptidoglycan DD-metalloendopeptidase family protein [Christensenellales bacterium]